MISGRNWCDIKWWLEHAMKENVSKGTKRQAIVEIDH